LISRNELTPLKNMKSYKPMFAKLQHWCHEHYRAALDVHFGQGTIVCDTCQQPLTTLLAPRKDLPTWLQADMFDFPWSDESRLTVTLCNHCQAACSISFSGLISTLPEARTFAQNHERTRITPSQALEAAGRPALLTRIESVTENAALVIISDEETYHVLSVEQEG
jgi:hypothetical protein